MRHYWGQHIIQLYRMRKKWDITGGNTLYNYTECGRNETLLGATHYTIIQNEEETGHYWGEHITQLYRMRKKWDITGGNTLYNYTEWGRNETLLGATHYTIIQNEEEMRHYWGQHIIQLYRMRKKWDITGGNTLYNYTEWGRNETLLGATHYTIIQNEEEMRHYWGQHITQLYRMRKKWDITGGNTLYNYTEWGRNETFLGATHYTIIQNEEEMRHYWGQHIIQLYRMRKKWDITGGNTLYNYTEWGRNGTLLGATHYTIIQNEEEMRHYWGQHIIQLYRMRKKWDITGGNTLYNYTEWGRNGTLLGATHYTIIQNEEEMGHYWGATHYTIIQNEEEMRHYWGQHIIQLYRMRKKWDITGGNTLHNYTEWGRNGTLLGATHYTIIQNEEEMRHYWGQHIIQLYRMRKKWDITGGNTLYNYTEWGRNETLLGATHYTIIQNEEEMRHYWGQHIIQLYRMRKKWDITGGNTLYNYTEWGRNETLLGATHYTIIQNEEEMRHYWGQHIIQLYRMRKKWDITGGNTLYNYTEWGRNETLLGATHYTIIQNEEEMRHYWGQHIIQLYRMRKKWDITGGNTLYNYTEWGRNETLLGATHYTIIQNEEEMRHYWGQHIIQLYRMRKKWDITGGNTLYNYTEWGRNETLLGATHYTIIQNEEEMGQWGAALV